METEGRDDGWTVGEPGADDAVGDRAVEDAAGRRMRSVALFFL